MTPISTVLLPILFKNNSDAQKREFDRLKQQFRKECDELLASPEGENAVIAFINTILTLETAAQIGHYDEMKVYGITADNKELASYELAAFAGFLHQSYRKHDYELGRQKAREFLQNPILGTVGEIGPIHYTPQSSPVPCKDLDGLNLEKMDKNIRMEFRDHIRDRVKEILKEFGVEGWCWGPIARATIDCVVVKPQLDKLLKL